MVILTEGLQSVIVRCDDAGRIETAVVGAIEGAANKFIAGAAAG